MHCKIYNRLVNGCSQDLRLNCHVYVWLWKKHHCLRFSSFLIVLFNCMCRDQWFNTACRMTGAEDTHSQGRQLSESRCICGRKILSSFHFCKVYNSLCGWLVAWLLTHSCDSVGRHLEHMILSCVHIFDYDTLKISFLRIRLGCR